MKLPILVLLILLSVSPTFAQLKVMVQDKGYFGLDAVNDSIYLHKYLEQQNQLLLIGRQNLQLLDLTNFKVIETRPIDLPYADLRGDLGYKVWAISPDGRRLVLTGLKEGRTKTKDEDKQTAYVLDLQTGKRVALLDHPERILKASWSKDGKTLMTMDSGRIDLFTGTLNVSFWDGETFAYRNSIAVENVTWIYLSNDGKRFFAASGRTKNRLGVKYVADAKSVVRVWKTESGEIEKTIAMGDAQFQPKTREIEISPDEKFLLLINKHKSAPAQHRLSVWEISGDLKQRYELQPRPKIDDSRVEFSPAGTLFAVDVGKNLQIYETETGKLKAELTKFELPSWGWLDNETMANVDFKAEKFFFPGKMMTAFDANDGRVLFKKRLAYDENEVPGTDLYNLPFKETEVTDDTAIRPHPTARMFLTSSDEFVELTDSRTGKLLQIVVSPPVVVDLMGKRRMTHAQMVLSADWSKDGRALYVFSANGRSVSLWKLIED